MTPEPPSDGEGEEDGASMVHEMRTTVTMGTLKNLTPNTTERWMLLKCRNVMVVANDGK